MSDELGAHHAPPTRVGKLEGLAYALFEPDCAPRGGVLVLHGADSRKESHFAFARECKAAGFAAIAFDQRGHGDSDGELGPRVRDDVATMAALLPDPVFLRGASMGGLLALCCAERVGARAVVAICPAEPDGMVRGLQAGRFAFRAQRPAVDDLFAMLDPEAAAISLGPDLLLMHAEGDESVPVEHSARLHAAAAGSRFERIPGGHHRSVQHDPDLQALSVKFLLDRV